MQVFAAWLNFTGARAVATQDILTTVNGVPRIRHYVVDFTKSLGSGAFDGAKLAWEGNDTILPGAGEIGHNIAGLGFVTPAWMKEKHPDLPEVGAFGSDAFDPEAWTPTDPMPPFVNRLPDDAFSFWAAKQVTAFTDDEIRAIVRRDSTANRPRSGLRKRSSSAATESGGCISAACCRWITCASMAPGSASMI
jgi:hypothetical protein